jgi:hypothetical protein
VKTIRLIRGDDPVLVSEAVSKAIDELIGDADRSLVLEELTESNYQHDDAVDLRSLVDACGTPPFLTDYRVVVGREMGSFTTAADVASLVTYLESPLDSTRLLLVYEKAPGGTRNGAPPKSLLEARKAAANMCSTDSGHTSPGRLSAYACGRQTACQTEYGAVVTAKFDKFVGAKRLPINLANVCLVLAPGAQNVPHVRQWPSVRYGRYGSAVGRSGGKDARGKKNWVVKRCRCVYRALLPKLD